ncbi:MAG: preprotein translocase subunit SecG [Candidatus Cloacimonetes bacterium 4572_65]|nr:MAG: preprotein translocase subunit SecG [Candidatus Cloacimonetes bacterium 4572_65]
MIVYILLVVHILISIALVLTILAQTSKGNGLDSSLGGAAANVFGSGASQMLRKWTQIIGTIFLVSCVFLAITVRNSKGSAGLPTVNPNAIKTETVLPTEETEAVTDVTPVTTDAPVKAEAEKK